MRARATALLSPANRRLCRPPPAGAVGGDYLRDFGLERCVEEFDSIEHTADRFCVDMPDGPVDIKADQVVIAAGTRPMIPAPVADSGFAL
jgi:hypothetical protein